MVAIAPGHYRMGLPAQASSERLEFENPQRTVTIGYQFSVGRFEITVGQFAEFLKDAGHVLAGEVGCAALNSDMQWAIDPNRDWRRPGFQQDDEHPVVCVSWADAKAYVAWLSKKTGRAYRLLSEAEWEFVARAGSRALRPWGDAESDACAYANVWDETVEKAFGFGRSAGSAAAPAVTIGNLGIRDGGGGSLSGSLGPWYRITHWCSDAHVYTAKAGKFRANRFGVHDMIGNVWEWVEDCMNVSYANAPSDGSAWTVGKCDRRVYRGASWSSVPSDAKVARRAFGGVAYRRADVGFRVAAK